jgi:hypothetical protein
MRPKNHIDLMRKLCACLFLCLLFAPGYLNAQPDTLELHRIWAVDLDQDVTALRLADLNGDAINEIFAALWRNDSGHIQVFSGSNGILSGTSESIRSGSITDMDVGDIDGDGDFEIVTVADARKYWKDWYGSLVCVLDAQELRSEWEEIIDFETLTCVEADDTDRDDTTEVFIGSRTWTYDTAFAGHKLAYVKQCEGALYYLDWTKKALHVEESSLSFSKLLACDIDHDSCNEIVCANALARAMEFVTGFRYHLRKVWLSLIDQDGSRFEFPTLFHSDHPFFDSFDPPQVRSMAVGDCDSDDDVEVVSYVYAGQDLFYDDYWNQYFAGPPKYILTVSDALSGIVQKSTYWAGDIVSLAIFDIDDQAPAEILIARANGKLEVIDGTTFDTVAVGDALPSISFFAFGDVTGDATPEICISDGDSLFLYGFGPTGVEEEKEVELASEFTLNQNYPNPFNAKTNIRYYLPQSSKVELAIYNIKGQKVKTLVDGFEIAGFKRISWDCKDRNGAEAASGVYFYRVKTDYSEETKKMVLLK